MTSIATRLAETRPELRTRSLAVIDIGSNTARLDLYHATAEGGLRTVTEVKEAPRLGDGLGPDLSLTPEAIARGVSTLQRFGRVLENWGNPRTVAVATSAVRDAPNGREFVARVARDTGITLRILSGEEEARYAYLGAATAWELHDDFVIDLGGGSLQAVTVNDGQLSSSASRALGVLRMTRRFLPHDPPRRRELRKLRLHIRSELGRLRLHRGRVSRRLFGVGGTIRSLARVAIARQRHPLPQPHGYSLTREGLAELSEVLLPLPSEGRKEYAGLSGARADVVPAGLVLVDELLTWARTDELIVTGTGIRSGLAAEVLGIRVPASTDEILHRSVSTLSGGLSFSLEHADLVRAGAVRLFELARRNRDFSEEDRQALSLAAWMHDSGQVIDIGPHARHSGYLIRNAPIVGLGHEAILNASLIAELSEGRPPRDSPAAELLETLRPRTRRTVEELGALLRVSEVAPGARFVLANVRGRHRLQVVSWGRGSRSLPPDTLKRLERIVHRAFGWEMELRGG